MSYAILEGGIGYEGKVTLTLKNNSHVLKSKTYKNNGTNQLFTFLCKCLAGSFEDAKPLLPSKILLLRNPAASPIGADPRLAIEQRSAWQSIAQSPSIITEAKTEQAKVIYTFEVSRAAIVGPFNQIALYGADTKDSDITDFSAYYFLVDEADNFELQDVSTWSPTTVLLIEWELTISNKNIEAINSRLGGV